MITYYIYTDEDGDQLEINKTHAESPEVAFQIENDSPAETGAVVTFDLSKRADQEHLANISDIIAELLNIAEENNDD